MNFLFFTACNMQKLKIKNKRIIKRKIQITSQVFSFKDTETTTGCKLAQLVQIAYFFACFCAI